MMSSAPSCSALSAASRAPSGEPLVSLGISVIFGLSKQNRDLHHAARAGDGGPRSAEAAAAPAAAGGEKQREGGESEPHDREIANDAE